MTIQGVSSVPISGLTETGQNARVTAVPQEAGQTFSQALEGLMQSQSSSEDLIQKLAAGEDLDLHQVMISNEEADINLRVALAIRDRLVDAYREVMHMSV